MAGVSDPDGTVVLTARRDAGAGLHLVTLTPPAALARGYHAPGQYIQVHCESPGYFVFAGEVGAPSWELLVRNSGGAADLLSTAPEGSTFPVTGPLGTGFPLARAEGRPLVVAVVGSALAVARPILRERIARGECDRTHVYIGARSPTDVPLAGEVAGWARAGARVVLCLSRADEPGSANVPLGREPGVLPTLLRRSGWVQRVLAEEVDAGIVRGALVFAAGPQAMLDAMHSLGEAVSSRGDEGGAQRRPEGIPSGTDLVELEVITNV